MPIDFTCPHCNHQTLVDDQFAGQTGPCSECGETIQIPGMNVALPVDANEPHGFATPYQAPANPGMPVKHTARERMLFPVDRSILAIVSGYLGLVSICLLPAPIALVTGVLAVRDIRKSEGRKHGMGRAVFGIVMGSLGSVVGDILRRRHAEVTDGSIQANTPAS